MKKQKKIYYIGLLTCVMSISTLTWGTTTAQYLTSMVTQLNMRYALLQYTEQIAGAMRLLRILVQQRHNLIYMPLLPPHNFTHPHLITLMRELQDRGSLQPLFSFAKNFDAALYTYDYNFMREYAQLLLVIYMKLLYYYMQDDAVLAVNKTPAWIFKMYEAYTHLEKLPLQQILASLELIVEQLPRFLEKYEFHDDISWQQWFKKYWWAVPIAVVSFGIRIILIFSGAHPMIANSGLLAHHTYNNPLAEIDAITVIKRTADISDSSEELL